MGDETRGRDEGDQDLFEDLDKFFAPIRDTDWPESQEPGSEESATGGGDTVASPDPSAPAPAGETEPSAPRHTEEEVLPPDWFEGAGVAPVDLNLPPTGEGPAFPTVPEGEPGKAPESGSGGSGEWVGPPTAQMTGEEWEELRTGPGQGEGEAGSEQGEGSEGTAAPQIAQPYSILGPYLGEEGEGPEEGAEPEAEQASGLSVDDLRKPPAEYADLPGPPETAEAGGEAEAPVEPEEVEGDVLGVFHEGSEEEDEDELVGPILPRDLWEEEPAGGGSEAAPPGGAEAAAEHFAESIRSDVEGHVTARSVSFDEPSGFDEPVRITSDRPTGLDVTDTLGGPSWQEPTSEEVLVQPEPGTPPRNLPIAVLSGIVLIVVGLGSLAISKAAFAVVATIVVVLAQAELYAAERRRGYQPATALGLAFGVLMMAGAYNRGEAGMVAMAALAVMFTLVWYMAVPARQRTNTLGNVAATLLPIAYIPFLAGFLILTLVVGTKALMLAVLGLAVGYDIAAFVVGTLSGRRPLAPTISPRKTLEGAGGAALVVVAASLAILPSIDPFTSGMQAFLLGVLVAIAAPLGDLAESALKRDLGVKDMGSIFPGHGGALDRIDSILFVAPVAWFFFRIIFF